MIYQNNFRYGEISRLTAGRFDMEAYSQGAFRFENAQTMVAGGFKRRPPLKIMAELQENLLRIIQFSISQTLSYCIGFTENKIKLYRNKLGSFTEVAEADYPTKADGSKQKLNESTIRKMSYTQYYDRMYFASNDFYPFFIEVSASTDQFVVKAMPFLTNKDGKKLISKVPSKETLEEGGASEDVLKLADKVVYARYEDGKLVYYFNDENDKEYYNQKYVFADSFPPVELSADTTMGFESFPDDNDFCDPNNSSTWPAVVSIINDSLYFANTTGRPHTIWKSRVLGSSQFIDDFSSDSMHDFIRFQFVYTESKDIVDADKMPQKPIENVFYQTSGNDAWYQPTKKPDGGNYSEAEWQYQKYDTELKRVQEVDPETDVVISTKYTYLGSGIEYDPIINGNPVRRPVLEYDFSDPSNIVNTTTDISLVATDSCAMKFDLNTGRQDSIVSITSACERIIVCTTTSEHMLPSAFSAVSNARADVYGHHGSLNLKPVTLNDSFLFIQRGNVMREFFLYEGYMNRADICAMNREILDCEIIEMTVKNAPDPIVYVVMEDGTLRTLIYDKELGIQAWSRWTFGNNKVKSVAVIEEGYKNMLLCVVENDGAYSICAFDEDTDNYKDFGTETYKTSVETTYAEIIDEKLVFGRYKRARNAWIRPYKTGFMFMGNDERQMKRTPNRLESEDYRFVLLGSSERKFSMKMESSEGDPMNILALAWEAE